MLDVIAGRSAGDILSRVVRIELGGQTYELPVRSIKANREWKTTLNERLAGFLSTVEETDDTPKLLALVATQVDDLLDMLVSYDSGHVLPSREEIEAIEPDVSMDLVQACREVWKAANPLVAAAIARMTEIPTGPTSPPTSSPPVSITGRQAKSRKS